MITTLLCDFSNVIVFSKGTASSISAYYHSLAEDRKIEDLLTFNTELLASLAQPPYVTLNKYIFSASSPMMLAAAQKKVCPPFQELISSREMGISKKETESYARVVGYLGVKPEETVFIDDSESNILVAKEVGLRTVQYFNNPELLATLSRLIRS